MLKIWYSCINEAFAKKNWNPAEIPPAFLPRPLLRAENQPRQGESIPPDKLFRLASSALVFLIIWILLEKHSNFVQQTPHLKIPPLRGGDFLMRRGASQLLGSREGFDPIEPCYNNSVSRRRPVDAVIRLLFSYYYDILSWY